jgi:hypothetical protein
MTGIGERVATPGVQTSRYRQSSLSAAASAAFHPKEA